MAAAVTAFDRYMSLGVALVGSPRRGRPRTVRRRQGGGAVLPDDPPLDTRRRAGADGGEERQHHGLLVTHPSSLSAALSLLGLGELLELEIVPQPEESAIARMAEQCRPQHRTGLVTPARLDQALDQAANRLHVVWGQLYGAAQAGQPCHPTFAEVQQAVVDQAFRLIRIELERAA